jgi:hypothetical protein
MENMLKIVQRYFDQQMNPDTIKTISSTYVHPIFYPLEPWEEPHPLRAGSTHAFENVLAHIWANMKWSFAPPWPFQGPPEGLRHTQLLTPTPGQAKTNHIQQKPQLEQKGKINDEDNPQAWLLSCNSFSSSNQPKYQSTSGGSDDNQNDNNEFLEYLHELDEEMGSLNFVGFKRAVSWKEGQPT